MKQVQLAKSAVFTDEMAFIRPFIQAAFAQGFDADWVEAVIDAAVANSCANFWPIMLAHIEIIPTQPDRQQQLDR